MLSAGTTYKCMPQKISAWRFQGLDQNRFQLSRGIVHQTLILVSVSPFESLIGKLDSENIEYFVIGDLNCNMTSTRYDNNTLKLKSVADVFLDSSDSSQNRQTKQSYSNYPSSVSTDRTAHAGDIETNPDSEDAKRRKKQGKVLRKCSLACNITIGLNQKELIYNLSRKESDETFESVKHVSTETSVIFS